MPWNLRLDVPFDLDIQAWSSQRLTFRPFGNRIRACGGPQEFAGTVIARPPAVHDGSHIHMYVNYASEDTSKNHKNIAHSAVSHWLATSFAAGRLLRATARICLSHLNGCESFTLTLGNGEMVKNYHCEVPAFQAHICTCCPARGCGCNFAFSRRRRGPKL